MKIFLSHNSRHKPLVREIKRYLPEHINLWIDEKDLLIGDDLNTSIKDAIETDTDFVIIFIDNYAIQSPWVLKELEWAINHEKEIRRTFLLPIVLEKEAWSKLVNDDLKGRKYLLCDDYSENHVKALANNLISELFAWLSRDLTYSGKEKIDPNLKAIKDAENFTAKLADDIRLIVYPYRKEEPLKLNNLFIILKEKKAIDSLSFDEFISLLSKLQQQGFLAGLINDGEEIYVKQEHYAWKTAFFTDTKKRIAKKAVSFIESGYVIALDSGSTTLEISKQLCVGLKSKIWEDLTIVTNSIPAATELLNLASEMGLEDKSSLFKVYIVGGRIRPNSLAIVNDEKLFKNITPNDFELILKPLGDADVAFVGTNGLYRDLGFAVHNDYEVKTKSDLIKFSKRSFILADPSKFKIKEQKMFASFDQQIEIITIQDQEDTIANLEKMIINTNTKILFA